MGTTKLENASTRLVARARTETSEHGTSPNMGILTPFEFDEPIAEVHQLCRSLDSPILKSSSVSFAFHSSLGFCTVDVQAVTLPLHEHGSNAKM